MKVLIDKFGKKIYVEKEKDIHTHLGFIEKQKLEHGKIIETNTGEKFIVLNPDFVDKFDTLERGPQIITLKDAGIISAFTGISSGSKVLEAGSGSGALTCYLANLVKPNGKIYSYEKRKDFLEIAKRNVQNFNLSEWVEFKNQSTHDSIEEKNLDVVILDMPDPWNSIKNAEESINIGGYLVCYLPNLSQVKELLKKSKETQFKLIKIADVNLKESKENFRFKPKIKHTAYLVFMRKLF